mgnify:CR=1 FL=1
MKPPAKAIRIKRPEAFVNEYRNIDRQSVRMKRLSSNTKLSSMNEDMIGKLVFVIRIKGYVIFLLGLCFL